MRRFPCVLIAVLCVLSAVAPQEAPKEPPAQGEGQVGPVEQLRGGLSKREALLYAENRTKLSSALQDLEGSDEMRAMTRREAAAAFRAGFRETDPNRPPPSVTVRSDAPIRLGHTFTPAQLQVIQQMIQDEPVKRQYLIWKLYGSNYRLWEQVRELKARLGEGVDWGPPTEEPPGDEEEPEDEPPSDEEPPESGELYFINCGSEQDRFFEGGSADVPFNLDVAPPYTSERYGNFIYSIPVETGEYEVELHFAEIYWGVFSPQGQEPGRRVFDVKIEGAVALQDFTLARPLDPVIKSFTKRVEDGFLTIEFTTKVDNASISAIKVMR